MLLNRDEKRTNKPTMFQNNPQPSDGITMQLIYDFRHSLRKSVRDLSQWKLYESSKWSAEALNSMVVTQDMDTFSQEGICKDHDCFETRMRPREIFPPGGLTYPQPKPSIDPMMDLNEEDYDLYLFTSSLFDCKEFNRCAYYLKDVKEPRLKFFKLYSEYLIWDKQFMETNENVLMTGKLDKKTFNHLREQDIMMVDGDKAALDTNVGDSFGERDPNKALDDVLVSETGHQTSLAILLSELREYMNSTINLKYLRKPNISDETKLGIALLYYLKGILLSRQGNKTSARNAFLNSLSYYIFNWGCWSELLGTITKIDEAQLLLKYIDEDFIIKSVVQNTQTETKTNVMIYFFKMAVNQEFFNASRESGSNVSSDIPDSAQEEVKYPFSEYCEPTETETQNNITAVPYSIDEFFRILGSLSIIMPNFSFLKAMNAMISYNYMDYANAELIFDDMVTKDPYRLEDLDIYSNILYVTQKQSKLAFLAQFVSRVDKFRPETCCIIANYYSARQEHEKSIMYFRRALILNKKSTSAWTLMGHEFVELKNSHAAIECYRRAVDINERDYKAWYGLGQAYEVLDMHLYSLYYFQKACALKPLDRRMWQAVAECYATLKDPKQATKCFLRAYELSSNPAQDVILLYKVAKQFEEMMDIHECKRHMLKCIEEGILHDISTHETINAKLWMAQYELRMKNYKEAYEYTSKLWDGTSEQLEEARNIKTKCRRFMK